LLVAAGVLLLLAAGAPAASAPPADKVAAHLEAIRKVGREGAGNAAAARAWKELVRRGRPVLPALLAGMADDEPVAANWLRTAVDAVAERAVAAGRPLPRAELEKFLADTRHARVARRLAYEWLVRVDPTAADRLLPKMLHDPSPELRRDAVARAIREAKALLDRDERKAATAAYRKAFAGAADQDQVDRIAEQLKELGVKVDLAAHLGVVRRWQLLGPFDHTGGVGFARAYPPERRIDLSAGYTGKAGKELRWQEHTTASPYGVVDLNKAVGKHMGAVAYAFAVIDSPRARPVQVRAGSTNAIKVFLNGKQVFAREEYHHGQAQDQYVARGTLKAGRNQLLLKVCQNEQKDDWAQNWSFQVRLCDPAGAAVPFHQPGPAVGKGRRP
jgi:hypothetical protein